MFFIGMLYILFVVLVGFLGSHYKRGGVFWAFIALIISPLIALILLLVLGVDPDYIEHKNKPITKMKVDKFFELYLSDSKHEKNETLRGVYVQLSNKITVDNDLLDAAIELMK